MDVLVVEDEWYVRPAIVQAVVSLRSDARVLEARSLKEVFTQLEENPQVELIVLDLQLEDSEGIDTLKRVREWCALRGATPRIVVLSANEDLRLLATVLRTYATGFIPKAGTRDDFCLGIDATLKGRIHIPEPTLKLLATYDMDVCDSVADPKGQVMGDGVFPDDFTPREQEVCGLMVAGKLSYKEIANAMELTDEGKPPSDETVRTHVNKIAAKLKVKTKLQVIVKLAELGVPARSGRK